MPNPPVRRMRTETAVARGAAKADKEPQEAQQREVKSSRKNNEERGHGYVSASVKDKHSTYYENHREVEVLREMFSDEDPPAHIRVGAGMTINLDNYESLRIDCAVTIPCNRERLQEAYEIASEFVAERISEEQVNWLGVADKTRSGKSGKGR